jgi:hypothetical protein
MSCDRNCDRTEEEDPFSHPDFLPELARLSEAFPKHTPKPRTNQKVLGDVSPVLRLRALDCELEKANVTIA